MLCLCSYLLLSLCSDSTPTWRSRTHYIKLLFLPCLRLTLLTVGGQITGLTERANEMLGGLGNVQSHFQCYYFNAIISFSDWVQILVLPFANAVTWAKLILK